MSESWDSLIMKLIGYLFDMKNLSSAGDAILNPNRNIMNRILLHSLSRECYYASIIEHIKECMINGHVTHWKHI